MGQSVLIYITFFSSAVFLLCVALFQPDGQRLCVQADQQLQQLFHAWRPKGTNQQSGSH